MQKLIDRTGETRLMNCGLKATIIKYRSATDLDIQFEDGAIVKHKVYSSFKKGEIRHPSKTNKAKAKERLGETRLMNCGLKATIIKYCSATDIDVQFEDGAIVKHRDYRDFKLGRIRHPNQTNKAKAKKRLGETRLMNCGLKATIIEYRGCEDIDVQFEDGAIVEHRAYLSFEKGEIKHPSKSYEAIAKKRLGETRLMKCGFKATIIKYRKFDDVDVQSEDGTILPHKSYGDFKKGTISHPKFTKRYKRIGETRLMNCGLKATIIEYRSSSDIDIQFEDGAIVEHRAYLSFEKGEIKHPSKTNEAIAKERIGETRIMKCKMKATIIEYRSASDIDVKFEDGTIVKHRGYDAFKKEKIGHPNKKTQEIKAEERIGETRLMNCGLKATIIKYRGATDIDIKFEDGDVVEHKAYREFKIGKIRHPSKTSEAKAKERIGETRIMKCKMKATIIEYRSASDIDVKFEDGAIVEHRVYNEFKKCTIQHPSKGRKTIIKERLGETRLMNCGLKATIIEYRKADDIDVQFEDGIVTKHKCYASFSKGEISHSVISIHYRAERFYNYTNLKLAYRLNDFVFYHCTNPEGEREILTLQEMMKRSGIKTVF